MSERPGPDRAVPSPQDRVVVEAQVGRTVRGAWRVATRCRYGHPQAIVTPPLLDDGTPFPTLFWLTCPFLVEKTGAIESVGEVAEWAARLANDEVLAARMLVADAHYRVLRAAEAPPGCDPCGDAGIAGQADPLATKCLHAHVACLLGGIEDPAGESVIARFGCECDDARCDALTCLQRGASVNARAGAHASRVAAIDIGTVTTRLLIAEVSPAGVEEVRRCTDITHLGEDLAETGALLPSAMQRVEAVIARYASEIAIHGVETVRTVATSASRDASNAQEFVAMLARHGVVPEIVSGDAEARLAFAGAAWGREGRDILVNDIGGGSTEIVFGAAGGDDVEVEFARSVDVGSRRVAERFLRSDPPTPLELDEARRWIADQFAPVIGELPARPRLSVALAGTATTLSAIDQGLGVYDPSKVHDAVLGRERIRELTGMLAGLPLRRRATEVAGLDPRRAPVIVAGGLILGGLLDLLGMNSTVVSEHDILYGIVLDLASHPNGKAGLE